MSLRGGAGEAGQRVPDAPGAPGPRPRRRRPARHRLGCGRFPGLRPERAPGSHLRSRHRRTRAAGTSAAGFYSAPAEGSARRRDATKAQNVRGGSGGSGLGSPTRRPAGRARALTRSPRKSAPLPGRPTPPSSSSDCRHGPCWGARGWGASAWRVRASWWRVSAADCHAAPRPAPFPCVGPRGLAALGSAGLQEGLVSANPGRRRAWTGKSAYVPAPPDLCLGVWPPSVRSLRGCALGSASECCTFEGVGVDGCLLWWCRDPAVAGSP